MSLVLVGIVLLVIAYFLLRKKGGASEPARDTTPALEAWIRDALELELAEGALGMTSSTPEERRRLARTLAHEPDAEIVSTIEDKVREVTLEYVRYAHESDVEVSVRVRYENGETGAASKRLSMADVPEDVRADFEKKASTRAFRVWSFPWQRAVAL